MLGISTNLQWEFKLSFSMDLFNHFLTSMANSGINELYRLAINLLGHYKKREGKSGQRFPLPTESWLPLLHMLHKLYMAATTTQFEGRGAG